VQLLALQAPNNGATFENLAGFVLALKSRNCLMKVQCGIRSFIGCNHTRDQFQALHVVTMSVDD